jgi:hypothetical protein
MVSEAVHRKREERKVQLYSSLNHPKVVVPVVSSPSALNSNIPSTSKDTSVTRPVTAPRTRKPSMAEVMGIGYALSSNDIEDMDKEVSEILESDASDDEERASTPSDSLGTTIERPKSSESEASLIRPIQDSSSSDEDFDEMAELLDHEMHYDDDDDDEFEHGSVSLVTECTSSVCPRKVITAVCPKLVNLSNHILRVFTTR